MASFRKTTILCCLSVAVTGVVGVLPAPTLLSRIRAEEAAMNPDSTSATEVAGETTAPLDLPARMDSIVFLIWTWILIAFLLYLLVQRIRASDRMHRAGLFSNEPARRQGESRKGQAMASGTSAAGRSESSRTNLPTG